MKELISYSRKRINLLQTTFISLILIFIFPAGLFSQEDDEPDNRPIRPPFETIALIDNQTTVNPYKGALQLEISHRFSEIKDMSDLLGIYGSANTRLALADSEFTGPGVFRAGYCFRTGPAQLERVSDA